MLAPMKGVKISLSDVIAGSISYVVEDKYII